MNKTKNKKLLLILLLVAFGMLGFSYAFVPMYRMLCQVLGVPTINLTVGETGSKSLPVEVIEDRVMTIRFMGNNVVGVPIELNPMQSKIKVKVGEQAMTAYTAQSHSEKAFDGLAVHTIIGFGEGEKDVAEYVELQQCFCFEEQLYPPMEEITLPLSFHITPDLPKDVHTITFGYTLFESEKQ